MDIKVVGRSRAARRFGTLVDSYSRRVYPAVLAEHGGSSVSSPLGVWLLLAACVSGAEGERRAALEDALGCPAAEASELLTEFMAAPPPALKAAIAMWVTVADATPKLADWVRGLPAAVESGFMPTQEQADAWADRHTLGLIRSFPLEIDMSRIVLASALATKVSWPVPFDVVAAREHLGGSSPWQSAVERLLWDSHPAGRAMIASTRSAGLVGVHFAVADEDLTVISVIADPDVPRAAVLDAAHEVAAVTVGNWADMSRSLFELPLGAGHSWDITEREARTYEAGQRIERIAGASLPAWRVEGRLDLQASPLFASSPACATLGALIDRPDDRSEAVQVAVASFTRYGFEAAAITVFARTAAGVRKPSEIGLERSAILRFDHPYAALAVAGRPSHPGQLARQESAFAALPLFTVWVNEPLEAEEAPA